VSRQKELDALNQKLIKYIEKHRMTPEGAMRILGRSMSSKSILVGSDFHCGSINALCSPDPIRDDGLQIVPTKQQKALYKFWETIPDQITKKPILFLANGEPCDGANKKNGGSGVWTTNMGDQINDFAKCMEVIPYEHMLLTRGSPYHVTVDGTNFEEIVAKQMQVDNYRAFGGGGKTDYEVNFEINGKFFNATHHVGFSRWWQYRTTPLAIELVKMHFSNDKRKFHTDFLIRSHVHYFARAGFLNTDAISTPAWKLPDAFMYRNGVPVYPDIGMVEIVVESNGSIIINPIVDYEVHIELSPMVKHY